jgi:hypothetical protein
MKEHGSEAEATRAKAIVHSLEAGNLKSEGVFEAFAELDRLPADVVREALGAWIGPEHAAPPKALRLRTVSVAKDADVLDLGTVAEEQLRIAGLTWDGADLAPEERLDGEIEGSFAGTLERRVLADASAGADRPLFDVMSFAGDSGVVFRAGSTQVVALIAYGRVETRDAATRAAIEEALAQDVVLPFGAEAPEEAIRAPAKKASAKGATKKTAGAKKTAAAKKAASAKKAATAAATPAAAKKAATAKKTGASKAKAASKTPRASKKSAAKT